MVQQCEIVLPAFNRGYHDISSIIYNSLSDLPETGIMHLFIKHTSAGLMINENASKSVRKDFENSIDALFPDSTSRYLHNDEGADDMPAHIKSSLIGQSLMIPISRHRLNLGTWQGIFLCEFRNHGGARNIVLTIIS